VSDLDQALWRLQQTALEYGGGLSNHGPMAAEALEALGHEALIPAFVDVYAPRLPELPSGEPIGSARQEASLGNGADADWVATFLAALETEPWAALLDRWLPRLLPGLFAAATHGALRTAHAVRAVGVQETPVRAREVAFGLAYWASRHQVLPGRPGSAPIPGRGPAALIAALEPVPLAQRAPGSFDAAVRVLDGREDFAREIDRFDPSVGDPSVLLSELCATSAGLYLAHPEMRIAYAHCVTGPSALRLLAGHLSSADLRGAIGHAVQVVAALHVTHALRSADAAPEPPPEQVRLAGEPAEMRYRAACSAEEHAIKLTEACLREDAIRPDRRLRLAAADAAVAMGTSPGGRGA
jgi:hypothetical protein